MMCRALLIPVVTAACGHLGGSPPDPSASPVLATLQRTGCYGPCPAYRLTVHENGVVVFERRTDEAGGRKGEPQRGRRLSGSELAELARAFERARFGSLSDYDTPECTDFQTVTVGWRGHTVTHYWGDRSAPEGLFELEAAFDRIVDTRRWLGRDPHNAEPNGTFCRHQLRISVIVNGRFGAS